MISSDGETYCGTLIKPLALLPPSTNNASSYSLLFSRDCSIWRWYSKLLGSSLLVFSGEGEGLICVLASREERTLDVIVNGVRFVGCMEVCCAAQGSERLTELRDACLQRELFQSESDRPMLRCDFENSKSEEATQRALHGTLQRLEVVVVVAFKNEECSSEAVVCEGPVAGGTTTEDPRHYFYISCPTYVSQSERID